MQKRIPPPKQWSGDDLDSRASRQFENMRWRFRTKKNKNGAILKQGQEMPFTISEYRSWVRAQFAAQRSRCPYCDISIFEWNYVVDHKDPIKRGGPPGLHNLALCCADCNTVKGNLTVAEYMGLREALMRIGLGALADVFKRLRLSGIAMQEMAKRAKEEGKKKSAAIVAITGDDDEDEDEPF